MTADTKAPENRSESHEFQADVSRLLHLMVHSVYSGRDIFLRELISNAADACEKLRYEAIANPALLADGAPFTISIALDKDAKRLTLSDNGIGMNRDDLTKALGTIASSGTRAFLDKLGKQASGKPDEGESDETGRQAAPQSDLIGQFGIGFYSAFMVAEKVEVETRRAGEEQAWRWTSDGKGRYDIAPLDVESAPSHGTRVILHMNDQSLEYLDPYKIEDIIREYSAAIAIPLDLIEEPGKELRRIGEGGALWAKPKSAITPEDYTGFYRTLAGQFDEPAMTLHWRAEGRHEYTVLAFIPGSPPFDLFDPARKGRARLHVRRVLISSDADILPGWLRFVRLVVDSADLPLNVSRELVQESPVFAAIKKGVTNRILVELAKLAENDNEKFLKIWKNFGAVLKEGLYEAPDQRDALFKIARFASSTHPETLRSLNDYIATLRPNQTAIYYITGEDARLLAASPQLEGYKARGIEVLLLSDPVDSFWVSTAAGFDGKPFKSVAQGSTDIALVPLADGSTAPEQAPPSEAIAKLIEHMKTVLAVDVSDVRVSDRLSDSPSCLVAPATGLDRRMERILAQHGQAGGMSKPVMEINPAHALVAGLAQRLESGTDIALVDDSLHLLLDQARLMDGEKQSDPIAFSARLIRLLTSVVGETKPAA